MSHFSVDKSRKYFLPSDVHLKILSSHHAYRKQDDTKNYGPYGIHEAINLHSKPEDEVFHIPKIHIKQNMIGFLSVWHRKKGESKKDLIISS